MLVLSYLVIWIVICTEKALPVNGSATRVDRHSIVPGWNEHVEPFRTKSLLRHKIWLENSKPKSGLVADIMRITRCEYHPHVKCVKRNIRFIQSYTMAKSVIERNTSDTGLRSNGLKGVNLL